MELALRRSAGVLLAALAALVFVMVPAGADARKPIISYVDQGQLKLFDAETAIDTILPVPVANPNTFDHGISHNGRYVFFTDGSQKLHLLDRELGQELPLPGIDVYANPGFLSASDFGVVAFDNNANGPAVVYSSSLKAFLPTGFAANNGHRQTQLSSGGVLVTTCMADCVLNLGNTAPYAQNLLNGANFGLPDDPDSDEEDPCAAGNAPLVGWHMGVPNAAGQKDVFVYDLFNRAFVSLPGLNSAVDDDTFCVLDNAGEYIGLAKENSSVLHLYERASGSFIPLPPRVGAPFNRGNAVFSMPSCAGRYATQIGTAMPDKIKGTAGPDVILGLEGNDRIKGLKGADVICGGPGKDVLKGGKGKDRLRGEEGKDTLRGGPGKDVLKGGPGKDDVEQ